MKEQSRTVAKNCGAVFAGILPGSLEVFVCHRKSIFRPPIGGRQRRGVFDLRDLSKKEIANKPGGLIGDLLLTIGLITFHHFVDPVTVWEEFIDAEFIGHPEPDQEGATNPGRKTKDIEQGKLSVSEKIPPGDPEIIL